MTGNQTNLTDTGTEIPFVFSQTTEISLTGKLISFHGILPRSHISGSYLEDAVASSLDIDPELHNYVHWSPGSHKPSADITLINKNNFGISVKSGKLKNNNVIISGHRFSKANGDLNEINHLLTEYRSDVTICFIYDNSNYAIYYIDKSVFLYPTSSKQWNATIGKNTGLITEYIYKTNNELIVKILPKLSWQVWWEVPVSICRKGFVISIPK